MLQLPSGFAHGEIACVRRVGGITLAEIVYPAGLRVPWHAHDHARFVLLLRGTLVETRSAGERAHEASTLLVRPAGDGHELATPADAARCLLVDVDAEWASKARSECPVLDVAADFRGGLLLHLARRLRGEFRLRDEVSRAVIASLVLGLAAEASRRVAREAAAREAAARELPPAWLQDVHDLLREQFAAAPTLAQIAAVAGVHPVHLARAFRQWYRCTVGEYLRELRLEFACREMAASDAPLAQIALAAGFCDQSHLTRLCKDRLGMTPAEYRAIHRAHATRG